MKFNADIATLISEIEDLSTLSKAALTTELMPKLKGTGPLTLFAPDNDALADSIQQDSISLMAVKLIKGLIKWTSAQ